MFGRFRCASKLTALRNYRRAKGLCFKCGKRWGKDHTCPPTVQMHIVKELLAMFPQDDAPQESPPTSPRSDEENLCTLSRQDEDGSSDPGVLQLHAWLQGHEILVMVDSGRDMVRPLWRLANSWCYNCGCSLGLH